MNSTGLITSEKENQRTRKVLFTCVVYTKNKNKNNNNNNNYNNNNNNIFNNILKKNYSILIG